MIIPAATRMRAAQALKAGMTKEGVMAALLLRINRDVRYLAVRHERGIHTTYDDQTERDLEALALAVCWLVEDTTSAMPEG